MLRSFLGAVVIVAVMSVLLYFMVAGALVIFIPFGAGILLGNSASQLGDLMRRTMAWDVVEEITDWPKVYELLGDKEQDGKTR